MAPPFKRVIPEGFPSGIKSRKQSKPNKSEVIRPANKIWANFCALSRKVSFGEAPVTPP